ncbi:MAG: ABC transporter ATP-binding protein [Acidimicrobiales bacterium]
MTELILEDINLTIGEKAILKNVNLHVKDKDFYVFLGPSGCGKTTTLRVIAGLVNETSGKIMMDGVNISDLPPSKRQLSMVFQDYALYPHKTVFENIAFPLRIAHKSIQEIRDKVKEVSSFLSIDALLPKKPSAISGGERQRVAIARALVKEPKLLLMDEPLSNLDAKLRDVVRFELKRIHKESGITTIYVTHDQVEAMTLGTNIAVMNSGHIVQNGPPMDVFEHPKNTFVASFIGSPPMNILKADGKSDTFSAKGASYIGIRPRAVFATKPDNMKYDMSFKVMVIGINLLGNEALVQGSIMGEHIYFYVNRDERDSVQEDHELNLYVDKRRVYLFDDQGNTLGRAVNDDVSEIVEK